MKYIAGVPPVSLCHLPFFPCNYPGLLITYHHNEQRRLNIASMSTKNTLERRKVRKSIARPIPSNKMTESSSFLFVCFSAFFLLFSSNFSSGIAQLDCSQGIKKKFSNALGPRGSGGTVCSQIRFVAYEVTFGMHRVWARSGPFRLY